MGQLVTQRVKYIEQKNLNGLKILDNSHTIAITYLINIGCWWERCIQWASEWFGLEWILPFAWWRHQMETFLRYWTFFAGIHRFPHNGQWRGALMFSLICVWIDGWVNNHEAGDLRRYRAHYDVIVMEYIIDCTVIKPTWIRSVLISWDDMKQLRGYGDTTTSNTQPNNHTAYGNSGEAWYYQFVISSDWLNGIKSVAIPMGLLPDA